MASSTSQKRQRRVRQPLNPFLRETVGRFKPTIGSIFLFSFFINLLTLAVPLYLLQIYSKVLPSGNIDTLAFLTGMALVAIIALGALEAIRKSMLSRAGVRFEHLLSEHLLDSAIHRSLVKSRASINVMRDLSSLRGFISGSTIVPLLDLPWTPLFLAILFVLHPLLGAIGVGGTLLLLGIAVANEFATRGRFRSSDRESRSMVEDAHGYVRNADVIHAMGMQRALLTRWKERSAAALVSSFQTSALNTRLDSLAKMIRLFLQIGIICAAAWLIVNQQLTAGATIASVLVLRRAIAPIEQSIRSWKSVRRAKESFHDISEYLDHASTLTETCDMPPPEGKLTVHKVSFRTPESNRSIFSRVSLQLEPGTFSALVGPTAAGKSTLLRLLAGLMPPTSGRITLGGFELDQWTREQLGPYIGYLPQDVKLFRGSVRENISRMMEAPVELVIEAAKLANAHELIQNLPNGYDTLLDEDGANLSGGQRQRIGLARAVFGEPRIVLLDEPDANLDSEGRSALRKSLRKLRRANIAVFAITHHTSLEKIADRVYRLDNGKLVIERAERIDRASDDLADSGLPKLLPPPDSIAASNQSPSLPGGRTRFKYRYARKAIKLDPPVFVVKAAPLQSELVASTATTLSERLRAATVTPVLAARGLGSSTAAEYDVRDVELCAPGVARITQPEFPPEPCSLTLDKAAPTDVASNIEHANRRRLARKRGRLGRRALASGNG